MPTMDFERLDWEDYPSTATPLSADNLNRLEDAMEGIYDDVGDQEEIIENILGNFAHVESTEVATKDYEQGEMLVLGDYLYKATAPIYTDETLVEDGNIVRTTISNEYGTDTTFNFGDVEYSTIASKSYAPGSYIVLNDTLYKVTVLIVAGDTIVPDTNVVKTTVGDEIKSIRNTSSTSYCKMPDGTLIEWGSKSVTTGTDKAPLGYNGSALVKFSPDFVSAPMVTVSANEHAGFWTAAVTNVTASQATVMIAGDQQSASRNVYWHAIGRWK